MSEINSLTAMPKIMIPVVENYRKRLGNPMSFETLSHATSAGPFYKVVTEKGTWLVKGLRPEVAASEIDVEQSVILSLRDYGFSQGVPYILDDADKPCTRWNEQYWTVRRYIDNQPKYDWTKPSWSVDTCVKVGEGLAHFHRAGYQALSRLTADSVDQQSLPLTNLATKADQTIKQWSTNLEIKIVGPEQISESTTWMQDEIVSAIKQLGDPEHGDQAPHTVVHGDYHAGNILFQGNRILSIIDLQYAHIGSPLFDLAYGSVMFGTNWLSNWSLQEAEETSPAIADWQAAFAMGYRKAVRQVGSNPAWLEAINDSALLHKYMRLSCFLIMFWALSPASSDSELKMRNRIYINALGLLRHLDLS